MIGRLLLLALAAVMLFIGFGYLFFPTGSIDAAVVRMLAPQGVSLAPPVRKTLLPGLVWDNLLISSEQGVLVRSDRLELRPRLLQLFRGRVAVAARAVVQGGKVELAYALNGRDALTLAADDINLSDIPFFASVLGARCAGIFWSRGELVRGAQGLSGEFKLEVRQLEFSGVRLGAFQLPDASGLKTQGMIRVSNGRSRLESLTLEGDGIYMRLTGDLPSGANAGVAPLNMTLEIMPKAWFIEKQKLVFMLLAKFMTSPGVYRIPVRGTLLKPEII